jgi:hypothetical protein
VKAAQGVSQKRSVGTGPKNKWPMLLWPIPSDGFELEVARWYYEPTEQRNGGEWFYFIRCTCQGGGSSRSRIWFSANAWRIREDYINKHRFGLEFVCVGPDLEVTLKSKRTPIRFGQEFNNFVATVRERAEKEHARYRRVLESRAW